MRVVIDGSAVHTERDLHDRLATELDFGPYYGNNLSALWDRLYRDVARPVELVWENSAASRAALGPESFERIAALLIKVMDSDSAHPPEKRFTVCFG
ncbi:MAG TPA: barstar family protein [Amycolatopsis sp.]|nr:barstar family protein [Amycolatopsis sp.]